MQLEDLRKGVQLKILQRGHSWRSYKAGAVGDLRQGVQLEDLRKGVQLEDLRKGAQLEIL